MINRIFPMKENIFLLKHTIERHCQLTLTFNDMIIYHKAKNLGKFFFFFQDKL